MKKEKEKVSYEAMVAIICIGLATALILTYKFAQMIGLNI